MTNKTTKTQNRVTAMLDAAPAMPPKPKIAATKEMIKNVMAQRSMVASFQG